MKVLITGGAGFIGSRLAMRLARDGASVTVLDNLSPQIHGPQIAATILNTPELRALWEKELAGMRQRIKEMRGALLGKLKEKGVKRDFGFITQQVGMFSYSGLTKEQMVRLRDEFGVYGIDTGRICVAALNTKNLDYVTESIAKVVA